jgi:hypothetical protein
VHRPAVHPPTGAGGDQRPVGAPGQGDVDQLGDHRRDDQTLSGPALTGQGQHPVTAFVAQVPDIGRDQLGDPQPEGDQQRDRSAGAGQLELVGDDERCVALPGLLPLRAT